MQARSGGVWKLHQTVKLGFGIASLAGEGWIFLQLYKHGLAYKTTMPVNWCTSCKCVLANEEVVEGVCEDGDLPAIDGVDSPHPLQLHAGFLLIGNGLTVKDAIPAVTKWLEEKGIGHEQINYKLRDWVFSRRG